MNKHACNRVVIGVLIALSVSINMNVCGTHVRTQTFGIGRPDDLENFVDFVLQFFTNNVGYEQESKKSASKKDLNERVLSTTEVFEADKIYTATRSSLADEKLKDIYKNLFHYYALNTENYALKQSHDIEREKFLKVNSEKEDEVKDESSALSYILYHPNLYDEFFGSILENDYSDNGNAELSGLSGFTREKLPPSEFNTPSEKLPFYSKKELLYNLRKVLEDKQDLYGSVIQRPHTISQYEAEIRQGRPIVQKAGSALDRADSQQGPPRRIYFDDGVESYIYRQRQTMLILYSLFVLGLLVFYVLVSTSVLKKRRRRSVDERLTDDSMNEWLISFKETSLFANIENAFKSVFSLNNFTYISQQLQNGLNTSSLDLLHNYPQPTPFNLIN